MVIGSAARIQSPGPTAPRVRPERAYFRPPEDRKTPRRVKRSSSLRIYNEVLGLDHLHFGLWNGEPLDLEGLRLAQQRYSDRLQELIPAGTTNILDVGSGTGALSLQLKRAGFAVEGLAPDPYQAELYADRVGEPFHLGRFQEFEPSHPYDLVLMSESAQYIWLEELFSAVRRTVDDGYWLVADYFMAPTAPPGGNRSGHPLDRFLAGASAAGFELEHREDVTEVSLATLMLAQQLVKRYVDSILEIGVDGFRERRPRLSALLARLFGRRIQRKLDQFRSAVDVDAFSRAKRYEIMLFRVPLVRT